ncbi:MAG: pyrimidine dimer DNA glycosylase/endonuclease V [Candidatus Moraniibacteriota bacterium]
MRIWDVEPKYLCRKHLLAEHRELHGLWNILTIHGGTGGYSRHPETLRWVGKTKALYVRHEELVSEFERRGYHHHTPLDENLATGNGIQDVFINTPEEQAKMLLAKPCECPNWQR